MANNTLNCHSDANANAIIAAAMEFAALLLTLIFFVNIWSLALILKKTFKPADMHFKKVLSNTICLTVAFLVIAFFDYFIADEVFAFTQEIWTAVTTSAMNMESLILLDYLLPDYDENDNPDQESSS